MRNSKVHKLNMRHHVESMNRLNSDTCGPLIKCMEGITGVGYTGISNKKMETASFKDMAESQTPVSAE